MVSTQALAKLSDLVNNWPARKRGSRNDKFVASTSEVELTAISHCYDSKTTFSADNSSYTLPLCSIQVSYHYLSFKLTNYIEIKILTSSHLVRAFSWARMYFSQFSAVQNRSMLFFVGSYFSHANNSYVFLCGSIDRGNFS